MKRKKANSAGIEMAAARAAQIAVPASAPAPEAPAAASPSPVSPGAKGVRLPASFTIRAVREFKSQLSSLDAAGAFDVDASDNSEIDTAGLQLLLAIRREVVGQGGELRWIAPSDLLRASARALGLAQELSLPEAA